ncbi:hypothetical protein ABFS83_06G052000 [Erythranthe nasuta]
MDVPTNIARSAVVVGSIDDLLIQILLHLPVKSLMRFKLVSTHWKFLITSRRFSLLRYPAPNPAVGLIYLRPQSSHYDYIHVDTKNPTNPPFKKLSFPGNPYPFWIHHSCNGLLLCCSNANFDIRYSRSPIRMCYVYNPTTSCFKNLPRPGVLQGVPRIVHGLNLAYDPAESPLYKVVCVRGSEFARELCQIEIYSSVSGAWSVSGEPFTATADFNHGVYWNGSIHWISYKTKEILYFDVEKEKFGKVGLPAAATLGDDVRYRQHREERYISYFGESCGHLHIIGNHQSYAAFDVYEMKVDYSGWFVVYHADLTAVAAAFADMSYLVPLSNRIHYSFTVLSLVRNDDKGSFLILRVPCTTVRFNLDCNTYEEICDVGGVATVNHRIPPAFDHIESLACV